MLLGVTKVIQMEGVKGRYITDALPISMLQHGLQVKVLLYSVDHLPSQTFQNLILAYVNYYVANGAVIVPKFGDQDADQREQNTLKELCPVRDIVQINFYNLANGGGGIHCATHGMISRTSIQQTNFNMQRFQVY